MPKKHSTSNKTRKRKGKDIDQIHEDLKPEKMHKLLHEAEIDYDLPGEGQFLCVVCDRHFTDAKTRDEHTKSRQHRIKLRELRDPPYTLKEAEAAAGMGVYDVTIKSKKQKDAERTKAKIEAELAEEAKKEVKMETASTA